MNPAPVKDHFRCRRCGGQLINVDTRWSLAIEGVRRRRKCANSQCEHRITTYELPPEAVELLYDDIDRCFAQIGELRNRVGKLRCRLLAERGQALAR